MSEKLMFCIEHIIFDNCEKLKFYKIFISLNFWDEIFQKKLISKFLIDFAKYFSLN